MQSRILTYTLLAFTLIVSALLYAPLFVPITASFFAVENGETAWNTPSLEAYFALMANAQIVGAFRVTLLVGCCVVVVSLFLGTLFALYRHAGKPGARFGEFLIFVPFVLPPIITGLSLLIFFRVVDFDRSIATIVIGHCVFVLAIVYRTILSRLQSISVNLVEASLDLGATRLQTFWRVILPNLSSALIGAGILAFALSFDETLISILVTGNQSTLPVTLWAMMRVGFSPDVNALVALILGITIIFCLLLSRLLLARRAS